MEREKAGIWIKKCVKKFGSSKKSSTFASQFSHGTLADRLGNGLQNRVEQFDSARYLTKKR